VAVLFCEFVELKVDGGSPGVYGRGLEEFGSYQGTDLSVPYLA
jgi:hypothetical protein